MVDLVISLQKVSLDSKINGILNICLSNENKQDQMSYQTIICKGQLVIQQKFRFNNFKRSQSRFIEQIPKTINLQKHQISLKFQLINNSCQFQRLNLYQKRLNFSSLHRKENSFLEYLNPKFGRGSMLSYTVKLQRQKQRQKQQNINLNNYQLSANLSNKGQITKNLSLLPMDSKCRESSLDLKKQLKSKQNDKINFNGKTNQNTKTQNQQIKINFHRHDDTNKVKTEQSKNKNENPIYKTSRNTDNLHNQSSTVMKRKLHEAQMKIESLETQIIKIKKESQIWRLQNKKLEHKMKQTESVIGDKQSEIERMKIKILNMQKCFQLKEDLLKKQIASKVKKIKELSQKNSESTMQISKLIQNFSDKQKSYFREIDRLKQLIIETSSSKKFQKNTNSKSETKFNYLSNDQLMKLKQISIKKFSLQDYDSNNSEEISQYTDLNMVEVKKSFDSQDSISTIYLQDGQNGVLMETKKKKKGKQLQRMYNDLKQKCQNLKILLVQQKQSINILNQSNLKLVNQLHKKEELIESQSSQIQKLRGQIRSSKNTQKKVK